MIDKETVADVIDKEIRPGLASHGGGIDLIDIKQKKVFVRLTGACGGCPMATMTLKMGVERVLKDAIPEIEEVVSV
ncbi:MAG: NifU family protein [Candidatus Eisenbacteria sp.]|nr:NifU family protein [Candidatus Eisenbacteria bacterium]